jgi:hypothetical protein
MVETASFPNYKWLIYNGRQLFFPFDLALPVPENSFWFGAILEKLSEAPHSGFFMYMI